MLTAGAYKLSENNHLKFARINKLRRAARASMAAKVDKEFGKCSSLAHLMFSLGW